MSLALAAKHLESQGRGKDTQLVHMTPSELKALNKLSIDSIGKPLSTNPRTGLPEAGFFRRNFTYSSWCCWYSNGHTNAVIGGWYWPCYICSYW